MPIKCLTPQAILADRNKEDNTRTHVVPCGKCPSCMAKRRAEWAFRLQYEANNNPSKFLTLTYAETRKTMNDRETLKKEDVQNFVKRLRKKAKVRLKYYYVAEYGDLLQRPHYHMILFGLHLKSFKEFDLIADTWKHGTVHFGDVNQATILYTMAYMMKGRWTPEHDYETGLEDDREAQYSMMSKNLGLSWITPQMGRYIIQNDVVSINTPGGYKIPIPRYYRKKLKETIMHKTRKKEGLTEEQVLNHDFSIIGNYRRYEKRVREQQEKLYQNEQGKSGKEQSEAIQQAWRQYIRREKERKDLKLFRATSEAF